MYLILKQLITKEIKVIVEVAHTYGKINTPISDVLGHGPELRENMQAYAVDVTRLRQLEVPAQK